MKVIFLGTPAFGVKALEKIYNSRHELIAAVCQPDKAGSHGKTVFSPVKNAALQLKVPVFQFEKISRDGVETLKSLNPDIMVTAAYGQILSQEVLNVAHHGVINIHGSLLPQLRGAAPIQYSVMKGDKVTGITILKTVLKVDAGEIILQKSLDIGENETSGELYDRMAELGASLVTEALDKIEDGTAVFTAQDESKVTFSQKITAEKEEIDFSDTAENVGNLIRALSPNPAAHTFLSGKLVKIYKIIKENETYTERAGTAVKVDKRGFSIVCGDGKALRITKLIQEGGKLVDGASFVNGRKVVYGDVFGKI